VYDVTPATVRLEVVSFRWDTTRRYCHARPARAYRRNIRSNVRKNLTTGAMMNNNLLQINHVKLAALRVGDGPNIALPKRPRRKWRIKLCVGLGVFKAIGAPRCLERFHIGWIRKPLPHFYFVEFSDGKPDSTLAFARADPRLREGKPSPSRGPCFS
jgi:hypothetical protein